MKTHNFALYAFLAFISIYLTACTDTPRATQFQQGVQQRVSNDEYKGIFMIRNIKKVNGYMLDDFYHAEMEYERLFLVNIDDAITMLDKDVRSKKSNDLFDELSKGLYSLASQSGLLKAGLVEQYGEFKQGDVIKGKITLQYLKTEQGWRLYKK